MTAPVTATNRWEGTPVVLPSRMLADVYARVAGSGDWRVAGIACVIALIVLPFLALPLAAVVLLLGTRQAWLRHEHGRAPGGLSAAKTTGVAFAGSIGATWLYAFGWFTGHRVVASIVSLVALEVLLARKGPAFTADHPWSHRRLVEALLLAGVLKRDRDDDPPKLRYLGKPRTDERGTTVTVELPTRVLWTDLAKAHDRIARELKMPARALHIGHDRQQHDGIVTLWFGKGDVPAEQPACLAADYRPSWRDGVTVGTDLQGRARSIVTRGKHTAIVGTTGSGKTALGRLIVADALLDPTVERLYVIDGKGDQDDWHPLADVPGVTFLAVTSSRDVPALESLLDEIEAEYARRASLGRDVSDVPLVVDEWYRIRMILAADKAAQGRLDARMAGLLAAVRSRGFQGLFLLQRGTAEYLPGDLKANIAQRIVGQTAAVAEIQYVLDSRPAVRPDEPGEFLLSLNEGGSSVIVRSPFLDDDGFRQVIDRAKALRAPAAPQPLALVKPAPPTDLAGAVRDILARADPGGVLASDLYDRLPADLRPDSVAQLGIRLTAFGWIKKRRTGPGSVWAFANPAQHPAHALHSIVHPTAPTLHDAGSTGLSHAQNGAAMPPPALARVMP